MKTWIKEHSYGFVLSYFIFYLIAFMLLEQFSVPKYKIHCLLDDYIPFCEFFIIPYFLWFLLLAVSLGYYLFKHKADFLNLCWIMFTGMTICIILYVFFPNGLELRTTLPRNNFLCDWVQWLYKVDTPTNVCPSIHVSSTIAIYEVTKRSPLFKTHKKVRLGLWILSVLICLSTLFLKQHSVIDVILGYFLTQLLTQILYHFKRKL